MTPYHTFTPEDRERARVGNLASRYRCVYCKRTMRDVHQLPVHEAQCDARYIMRRMWTMLYSKAERAERRLGAPRKDGA